MLALFFCTRLPPPNSHLKPPVRCPVSASHFSKKVASLPVISAVPLRNPLPEGPARHLDVSRQKLSPQCLETILDSQLSSPKLSPKMPPKLSLTHKRGHFVLFQNYPRGEGNCETIERQKLSRGNFCPGVPDFRGFANPEGPAIEKIQSRLIA